MELKKKKMAILVEDLYQELEVWYPILRLKEAGGGVIVVGTGTKSVYVSKLGYEVKADTEAKKVKVEDINGIIIPGGYAPDRLRQYGAVNSLVRETYLKGKVVAAICHGAWVLVSANILKGHKATCFFAIKDDVINAGAKYVDKEVVIDGNLITSRKPEDLPAFMKAVFKALS